MLEIQGDYLEGGGAIVRLACALASLTHTSIKITNIRANRPEPGLKSQHLEGIRALAELCNGKIKHAVLGSKEIEFYPGKIESKFLRIKISTAGSVGLIFQILKLPACIAESGVKVRIQGGGTFGKYAPPLLYTQNVLIPLLEKMGYKANIHILRHGFFPKGGADVKMEFFHINRFLPLDLVEKGELIGIKGISVASKFLEKAKVAERQADACKKIILEKTGIIPEIKTMYVESLCPGSGIVTWAEYENSILGADALGEKGKPSEKIGKEAGMKLFQIISSGASVDEHLSDQILPFMALSEGISQITASELTTHAKTNIWLIEKFLPVKFVIKKTGKLFRISCKGVGFQI